MWVGNHVTTALPGGVGLRSEHPGITRAMGLSMSWDPWPRPVATLALSLAAQARARRARCLAWRRRLLGGRSSLGRENRPTRVVAPPLGWRLHRGVSPRKPLKSQELRGFGIVFPNIVNMSSGKLAG